MGPTQAYPKGYHFYSPQSSTVIKSKMAATAIYPGYQRCFLACDEELRRPQADTSSAWPKPETAHEKSLVPRVTAIRTRARFRLPKIGLHCRLRLNKIERLCNLTGNRTRWTLQVRYLDEKLEHSPSLWVMKIMSNVLMYGKLTPKLRLS